MKVIIVLAFFFVALSAVQGKKVFLDNFNKGTFDPSDPDSPYFYFPFSATEFADDGVIEYGNSFVVERAFPFTLTTPQGPAGGLDHVKTLQYLKESFDPGNNCTLLYSLRVSGKTQGTENHPFGAAAVTNDQDDIRLAGSAMNMLDARTWIVADFFISNEGVWAFYERLPFGKGTPELGNYRAFSSTKRVADRSSPNEIHNLRIDYDRGLGEIRWYVDNDEVLVVDNIGVPSPNPDVKLILDHGGIDTTVDPLGFQVGFGLFTLLDMADPNNPTVNEGLVKISDLPGFYAYPTNFVDELSLDGSRLWGQGAQISLYKLKVEYKGNDCVDVPSSRSSSSSSASSSSRSSSSSSEEDD